MMKLSTDLLVWLNPNQQKSRSAELVPLTFEAINTTSIPYYQRIDTVNQGNSSLSIKLILECFIIVA